MSTVIAKGAPKAQTSLVSPTGSLSDAEKKNPLVSEKNASDESLPLGEAVAEKRFWFQRSKKNYDPNAIATLVSMNTH